MKKAILKKALICLALCFAILLSTAACTTGEEPIEELVYSEPDNFDMGKSIGNVVAKNDRYELQWTSKGAKVVLYDKVEDCEWSYLPFQEFGKALDTEYDEDGIDKTAHPQLESAIRVWYYHVKNSSNFMDTTSKVASVNKKKYTVEKIDNGIRITFYFEQFKFAIPLDIVLLADGVNFAIDPNKIQEDEDYKVSSIELAPFFCSVRNSALEEKTPITLSDGTVVTPALPPEGYEDNYYVFIPSGSGSIIKPIGSNTTPYSSEEPLYGGDENIFKAELTSLSEGLRLPVYGAVNGNRGVCAIIDSGSECATLGTEVAKNVTRYTRVYSKFYIRGYQRSETTLFTNTVVEPYLFADHKNQEKISVSFYPLYNEDASYVGMANRYKKYLNDTGAMSGKNSDDKLVNLKVVGGVQSTAFTLGIPRKTMLTATTVKEAEAIIKEISELTGEKINANLIGFGSNGMDIGKIGGNFKLNGSFGSAKDLNNLAAYGESSGNNIFFNFDIIRYNSSGAGVSKSYDRASAANDDYTTKHFFSKVFRTPNEEGTAYSLVNRALLNSLADKASESVANWNLKGVSLDTLTSSIYSDYDDIKYYSANNFKNQTDEIMKSLKDKNLYIAGSDANAFAAVYCNHIYDTPLQSSKYKFYTEDVPFYEMVFKGSVSMSTNSLNFETNKNLSILKAIESGLGFTYTVMNDFDVNMISADQNAYYASVYSDNKDTIINDVNKYKSYFDAVKNASIKDHEILANGLRKTTFSNGTVIYVNYTNEALTDNGKTVEGTNYLVVKEAV